MKGIVWLVLGLLFGFAALGVLGFGIYAINHTQKNVRLYEDLLGRDMLELKEVKDQRKVEELRRLVELDKEMLREGESYRDIAFLIAGSSVCPGFIAIILVLVFLFKFRGVPESKKWGR